MNLLLAFALEGRGNLAYELGDHVWAVLLWSAANVLREEMGAPLPPVDKVEYTTRVKKVRLLLGEGRFQDIWQEARQKTTEQILSRPEPDPGTYSNSGIEISFSRPHISTRDMTEKAIANGITRREMEVLRLVAEG